MFCINLPTYACMVSATVQYYGAKLISAKVSSRRKPKRFHKFSFQTALTIYRFNINYEVNFVSISFTMNTSMYEQISDEVSKCLMLNGICLVHSEHKIKTNHKVG